MTKMTLVECPCGYKLWIDDDSPKYLCPKCGLGFELDPVSRND